MTARLAHKHPFGSTGNPYNMLLVSLLLHLIVIAAAIITLPATSKPLTFGTTYSVALVGPEAIQSHREITLPKDVDQPPSSIPSAILKRSLSSSRITPLDRKDDAARRDIEKAINAIRQKDQDGRQANRMPAGASTDPSARAGDYSRFIWPRIKKNWALPASLMPKENITAIIEVRIGQSGALEYIGFEQRSGNSTFDESALRAVKKSAPFPPLTGWSAGRSIEIGIRFHSAELR